MHNLKWGVAAMCIAACGSLSSVRAATLDTLVAGGQLTAGGLTFSSFSYDESGGRPAASSIVVTASTAQAGQVSLTFSRTSGTWVAGDVTPIDFFVTGTSPILEVGLSFVATGSETAYAHVGETLVDTATNTTLPGLQVFTDGAGPLPDTFSATLPLTTPSSSLHVYKSIDLSSAGGSATITSVTNTYSGSAGAPEPATLGVLGAGAFGLLVGRRRR